MVLSLLLMQVALKLSTTAQTAHTAQTRLRLWLSAGVLLGLAGLSKYTAILPAAALILTLSSTQGLRWLLSPGPWLALVIACCLVSPVFYWNAQHEWVSFVYQLNHGSGGQWRARRLLAFVGLQLVAYGPLLFLGGSLALRQLAGSRNWPALGLLSFFLLPFLVTAVLSGGGSLPHWTGPAWLALIPFAAHALAAFCWNPRDQPATRLGQKKPARRHVGLGCCRSPCSRIGTHLTHTVDFSQKLDSREPHGLVCPTARYLCA